MLQGPLLKVHQLSYVLDIPYRFRPYVPARESPIQLRQHHCYITHNYPRRSNRTSSHRYITHGDVTQLPNHL